RRLHDGLNSFFAVSYGPLRELAFCYVFRDHDDTGRLASLIFYDPAVGLDVTDPSVLEQEAEFSGPPLPCPYGLPEELLHALAVFGMNVSERISSAKVLASKKHLIGRAGVEPAPFQIEDGYKVGDIFGN